MASFKSILSPTKSLAATINGVIVNLTFDPNVITPRLEDEMKEAAKTDGATRAYLDVMARWIKSWDLTDDPEDGVTGPLLPITVETLSGFPDDILQQLSKAIRAASSGNETNS